MSPRAQELPLTSRPRLRCRNHSELCVPDARAAKQRAPPAPAPAHTKLSGCVIALVRTHDQRRQAREPSPPPPTSCLHRYTQRGGNNPPVLLVGEGWAYRIVVLVIGATDGHQIAAAVVDELARALAPRLALICSRASNESQSNSKRHEISWQRRRVPRAAACLTPTCHSTRSSNELVPLAPRLRRDPQLARLDIDGHLFC